VRIHLPWEHALEFKPLDFLGEPLRIGFDLIRRARIRFSLGQFQQFRAVGQAAGEPVQGADDLFEFRALSAEFLGPFRVVPDLGLLEFPRYFL
jgi:hypothetical protein